MHRCSADFGNESNATGWNFRYSIPIGFANISRGPTRPCGNCGSAARNREASALRHEAALIERACIWPRGAHRRRGISRLHLNRLQCSIIGNSTRACRHLRLMRPIDSGWTREILKMAEIGFKAGKMGASLESHIVERCPMGTDCSSFAWQEGRSWPVGKGQ